MGIGFSIPFFGKKETNHDDGRRTEEANDRPEPVWAPDAGGIQVADLPDSDGEEDAPDSSGITVRSEPVPEGQGGEDVIRKILSSPDKQAEEDSGNESGGEEESQGETTGVMDLPQPPPPPEPEPPAAIDPEEEDRRLEMAILASEEGRKWGTSGKNQEEDGSGRNQGVVHFLDYRKDAEHAGKYIGDIYIPGRIESLEGLFGQEFPKNLDGFRSFTECAERVIASCTDSYSERKCYRKNGSYVTKLSEYFYKELVPGRKQGVLVIRDGGRLQTMYPIDRSQFNAKKRNAQQGSHH